MELDIYRPSIDDSHVIRNMMELYQHDHAQFEDAELNEHGLYGYKHLDHYWTDPGRHPFLIRVDGKLAGFALVRDASDTGNVNHMAEFFIVRKYRRSGIGRKAAYFIFDLFPGKWEVGQVELNEPARGFWSTIISDYSGGQCEEHTENDWGKGPIRYFESRCNGGTES